jgi:hypothetical protein
LRTKFVASTGLRDETPNLIAKEHPKYLSYWTEVLGCFGCWPSNSVNTALRLKAHPMTLQWAIMAVGPKDDLTGRIGHGRHHKGQEF